ncbi:hypothetical protein [Roseibacillus ishigakijimensis]|uniref:Uncharacterized protein n=1 Tax=Roseibacillus ishigakijimensis TaxID=454146 RepID=A0A934RRJ4_9BACT|nr:hypothetical protein [Roseibacillus ishigakijimensis]MBK1835645.1 hypothetical protein [Roseibacillus ishigakijimensis]
MAYWGLGEIRDGSSLPALKTFLAMELQRETVDRHTLWQLISGLEKADENIAKDLNSDDWEDFEKLKATAQNYLHQEL